MTDNRIPMIQWGPDPAEVPDISAARHEPPELCPGCRLPLDQGSHGNCTPGMWSRPKTNPERFQHRRGHVRAGVIDTAIEVVTERLGVNRADAALIVAALNDDTELITAIVRTMPVEALRAALTTATSRILTTGQDTQETR